MAATRIPNIDEQGNFMDTDVIDRLRESIGTDPAATSALRWWWANLAGANTAPADVMVVSSSTGEGAGAQARQNRWVDRFLSTLRRAHQPEGVPGGEGYTPAGYSGGTIPNPWDYTTGGEHPGPLIQDAFTRTGNLSGSTPTIGPEAWTGAAADYTLNGTHAVATKGNAIAIIRPGVSAAQGISSRVVGFIPQRTLTANTEYQQGIAYVDSTNFLAIRGVVSTTTNAWTLRKYHDGTHTALATFATAPIPATAGTPIDATITLDGSTVTATINGQTITATLDAADTTKYAAGLSTKIQSPLPGTELDSYTVESLAEPVLTPVTSVTPTLLGDRGLGVRAIRLGAGETATSMSRTFTGTGIDVFVQATTTSAPVHVAIDGATPTSHPTAQAATVDGYRISTRGLTAGQHTIRITVPSGRTVVEGVMVYNGDEDKGIRLWEASKSGSRAANFALASARWNLSAANMLTPDLVIIGLGSNEYSQQNTIESFKTAMGEVIGKLRAINADVSIVLHNHYQRGGMSNPAIPFQDYLDAIDELGVEHGVVVADLYTRMLGWDLVTETYRTMWDADTVHPSPQGHGVIKDILYNAVKP